jgi:hypothetical protein
MTKLKMLASYLCFSLIYLPIIFWYLLDPTLICYYKVNFSADHSNLFQKDMIPMNDGTNGKLLWVGDEMVKYDPDGRISKIGQEEVVYGFDEKIILIGDDLVQYNSEGKIKKIGEEMVMYDNEGNILLIGKNTVLYEQST